MSLLFIASIDNPLRAVDRRHSLEQRPLSPPLTAEREQGYLCYRNVAGLPTHRREQEAVPIAEGPFSGTFLVPYHVRVSLKDPSNLYDEHLSAVLFLVEWRSEENGVLAFGHLPWCYTAVASSFDKAAGLQFAVESRLLDGTDGEAISTIMSGDGDSWRKPRRVEIA